MCVYEITSVYIAIKASSHLGEGGRDFGRKAGLVAKGEELAALGVRVAKREAEPDAVREAARTYSSSGSRDYRTVTLAKHGFEEGSRRT